MTTPISPGYPWQMGQTLTAASLDARFAQCVTAPVTTLPINSIVLNDGAGGIISVASLGTSGQVLTSAGNALPPTWTNASVYNPADVTITGGTIDGTVIGSSTPAAVYGTQLHSTISTGTPPLVVSSTTEVSNLNAATATNIAGGSSGSIPYQTSSGSTALLAIGSDTEVLTLSGGLPTWAAGGGGGSYNPAAVAITGGTISVSTLATTSTITPNTVAGIVGTTLGDNAQAGSVGETILVTHTLGSGVFGSGALNNVILNEPLSAGFWLVFGSIDFAPDAGTTITSVAGGISTSASVLPSSPFVSGFDISTIHGVGITMPAQIMNVTGSSTLLSVIGFAFFSGSTCQCTANLTCIRLR